MAAAEPAPVVMLPDRTSSSPLPTEAGVYLFKDPNCLGKCAKVRGFADRLETWFAWTPRSAYAVGAGALWDVVLTSPTRPLPDAVFPPNTTTRRNVLTFIPKAAEKR